MIYQALKHRNLLEKLWGWYASSEVNVGNPTFVLHIKEYSAYQPHKHLFGGDKKTTCLLV